MKENNSHPYKAEEKGHAYLLQSDFTTENAISGLKTKSASREEKGRKRRDRATIL